MILSIVALFFQMAQTPAVSPQPDARPVRVWLDSNSPLTRGSSVRVYVQAAQDGNLVVLHRRTDGRIEVLFPGHPADEPRVRAGTYEIRGPGDGASFVVSEPDGTGMILAALSPDPVRFDEFVRAAAWNPDALVPSWSGADPEGALSDIVQRMLGDGYFNYDFVTYTVAPAVYAQQDAMPEYAPYPSCPGCTFIGFQLVLNEPFSVCDAFFGACLGFPRFHHRASLCDTTSACSVTRTSVLALNLRSGAGIGPVPRSREFVMPHRGGASSPIGPRSRLPITDGPAHAARPVGALPLVPGTLPIGGHPPRAIIATRRRAASALGGVAPAPMTVAAPTTPIRHVPFTRLSTPAREEPRPTGEAHGVAQLVVVPRGVVTVSREGTAAAVIRSGMETSWGAAQPRPRSRSTADGGGAAQQTHGVALPGAAWQGTGLRGMGGVRVGPAHTGRLRY